MKRVILLVFMFMFFGIINVNADSDYVPVCVYEQDGKTMVELSVNFLPKNDELVNNENFANIHNIQIGYVKKDTLYFGAYYPWEFATSKSIYYGEKNKTFNVGDASLDGALENFTCPKYAFMEFHIFTANEFCFSNNTINSCQELKVKSIPLNEDKGLFAEINKYAAMYYVRAFENYIKNVNVYELVQKGTLTENSKDEDIFKIIHLDDDSLRDIKDKTRSYIDQLYKFNTEYNPDPRSKWYQVPDFVNNYIENLTLDSIKEKLNSSQSEQCNSALKQAQNKEKEQIDNDRVKDKLSCEDCQKNFDNGYYTEQEYVYCVNNMEACKEKVDQKYDGYQETISQIYGAIYNGFILQPGPTVDPSEDPGCNGLLGPTLSNVVRHVFDTIKYGGPILTVLITILDVLKVVMSGNADDLKKSFGKFIKRAIAAICLFFIPIICELIFEIAGVFVPEYCITLGINHISLY